MLTISASETHPNYPVYSHMLSPGWIPGRKAVCERCLLLLNEHDGRMGKGQSS